MCSLLQQQIKDLTDVVVKVSAENAQLKKADTSGVEHERVEAERLLNKGERTERGCTYSQSMMNPPFADLNLVIDG